MVTSTEAKKRGRPKSLLPCKMSIRMSKAQETKLKKLMKATGVDKTSVMNTALSAYAKEWGIG